VGIGSARVGWCLTLGKDGTGGGKGRAPVRRGVARPRPDPAGRGEAATRGGW